MCVCVRMWIRGEEKRLFVLAGRSFAKEVAPQPILTKQTRSSECFISPSTSAGEMRRWPFYSSHSLLLFTAKRVDGELPLGHF